MSGCPLYRVNLPCQLCEAQWRKPGLDDTHFLPAIGLQKKDDKAGAMEASWRAYPPAPQKPEYNADYEELLRRE
jgi:hypothetical protein